MKISTIKDLLEAEVVCCEEELGAHVYSACGSDMMSDVLAYVKDQAVLLTGLVNPSIENTGEGNTPAVIIPTGSASALYTVYNPTE